MVAVGTADGPIETCTLATGGLICCFESCGDGPGQIVGWATGIRFTPGGSCLLVAENHTYRMPATVHSEWCVREAYRRWRALCM